MDHPEPQNPAQQTVAFHFEKVSTYATHHADGALGGVTPADDIFFSFYVERPPIPKMVEQILNPDGSLGAVVNASCREGIYREIQTGVVMSKTTARVLLARLVELLEEPEENEQEVPAP